MNLMSIVRFLEAEGLGVEGQTIFLNFFPANVSEGILIRPPLTGFRLDESMPGYIKGSFSVAVRSASHSGATTLANNVAKALSWRGEREYDGILFKRLFPESTPATYPLSEGGLVECGCRFAVVAVSDEWK
jgi:hypothetical protein